MNPHVKPEIMSYDNNSKIKIQLRRNRVHILFNDHKSIYIPAKVHMHLAASFVAVYLA